MRSNRTCKRVRRATWLSLEQLERRWVPSLYTVTELGGLNSGADVNDAGQVAASSANLSTGYHTHAFLWNDRGTTDLGTLGGIASNGYAINNAGQVVGNSQTAASPYNHAFVWQNGVMTDLLPMYTGSTAGAINDLGQIVGTYDTGGRAYLWNGGVLTDLGQLSSFGGTSPSDVNNAGQVVGSSYAVFHDDLGALQHAFLWQGGVLTDLGVLPGFDETFAYRINSSGQVVGSATRTDMSTYELFSTAFLYSNGTMTDLGVPDVHSGASGINDSGQVVGWMRGAGGFDPDRAFLYDDGVVTDLNTLVPSGYTVSGAIAINNAGQILARGGRTGGTSGVLLLNPIDPSTPSIRIGDATIAEGNTGTRIASFTVTLSNASGQPVTVSYSTANGTASAGSDYQAVSGSITIAPGQTVATIAVPVKGDRVGELNETFTVNLGQPTNAVLDDGQGAGTIVDDEPRISIGDVTRQEGNSGTTTFVFTVSLSSAYDAPVTLRYATANGSARSTEDYTAAAGSITFAPGEVSKTISIVVKGDKKKEGNETFFVNLSGASSGWILDGQAIGTILDEDN